MKSNPIGKFVARHYRHFNAAALSDAADGYRELIASGGRMLMTLAGAMSTAEIGVSLAEMIRQEKIHAISCTGANLEEDLFNLVAHDEYLRIPNYRDLTPEAEQDLFDQSFNRVTDTCIPEKAAMLKLDHAIRELWYRAEAEGKRFLPHEYVYQLLRSRILADSYQIDPRDSWVVAACEKDLPLFVPGWEDSTLGNVFASYCIKGTIKNPQTVRNGIEYMVSLADWYRETSRQGPIGFFQIGGGIAGDFAICVVPMLKLDLKLEDTPLWSYFCQISDSVTSFGSYSGAVPNEKITWGKLAVDTPRYVIESDATIVAPLIFACVLDE